MKRKEITTSPVSREDIWALWPDDYMCPIGEVEGELMWRSDDYMLVVVTEYDGACMPDRWHPYKK
jgi:hypothetical protein